MRKRHGFLIAPVTVVLIAVFLVCSSAMAKGHRIPKKVNEKEALNLVVKALGNPAVRGDLSYQGKGMDPVFFVFDGLNPPPARWGSFGFFAVNPWTGDVWALWGCHELTSPALRKAQGAIRRRFTSKELNHYAELGDLKPDCIFEDPEPDLKDTPKYYI